MKMTAGNKKKFPPFECKRCGKCCKEEYVLPYITKEEWVPIIEFVKIKYAGRLKIKDMEYPSDYDMYDFNNREETFFKDIDDIASKLFWIFDNGKCPFIKKKRNADYYCEIYDIRPRICTNYRCDLDGDDFGIYLKQISETKLKK